jgi:hypothetical protein
VRRRFNTTAGRQDGTTYHVIARHEAIQRLQVPRHCEVRSNPEKRGMKVLLTGLLHFVRNDEGVGIRNEGKLIN